MTTWPARRLPDHLDRTHTLSCSSPSPTGSWRPPCGGLRSGVRSVASTYPVRDGPPDLVFGVNSAPNTAMSRAAEKIVPVEVTDNEGAPSVVDEAFTRPRSKSMAKLASSSDARGRGVVAGTIRGLRSEPSPPIKSVESCMGVPHHHRPQ